MNYRISSLFILIKMVSVIEKFLLVLGLEEGLDSESPFEVVRHLLIVRGRTKLFYLIQG